MSDSFLSYFPEWTPYPEELNAISGIVEIAGELALLVPRDRIQQTAGVLLALYVALVFPVNVYVAVADVEVPGLPDVWWYRWVPLPFQVLFIWWGLRSTAREETQDVRSMNRRHQWLVDAR